MSGQLVIAELEAFRAVLGKVKRCEGETVTLWCRSTITNALHRVGPTGPMKSAAEAAWIAADQLAKRLEENDTTDGAIEQAREQAEDALAGLIAAVRLVKAAGPSEG